MERISNGSFIVRTIAGAVLAGSVLLGAAAGSVEADFAPLRSDGGGIALDTSRNEVDGFASFTKDTEVVLADFTPAQPLSTSELRGDIDGLTSGEGGTVGARSHMGPSDKTGGVGCSIQCITSGKAYARGAGAELEVKTHTPARIRIYVFNEDGYSNMADSGEGSQVYSFSALFDDLEAGSLYYAIATAEDSQGYESDGFGEFETLTRNVEIVFTQATINDAPYGGTPYAMYTYINGEWLFPNGENTYQPEGSTLPLGINMITRQDVGRYLDLAITLAQNNPDPDGTCEVVDVTWGAPSAGSEDCTVWASAFLSDVQSDLDARPANATSWTYHSLQRTLQLPGGGALPGGYGSPLNFSVVVTLNVTYD